MFINSKNCAFKKNMQCSKALNMHLPKKTHSSSVLSECVFDLCYFEHCLLEQAVESTFLEEEEKNNKRSLPRNLLPSPLLSAAIEMR